MKIVLIFQFLEKLFELINQKDFKFKIKLQ